VKILFTQIEVSDDWLYALDHSGRVWRRRHEDLQMTLGIKVADWEMLDVPTLGGGKKRTDWDQLQDMQEELRKGLCPNGLEPHGDVCPRCGMKRKLMPVKGELQPVWCHIEEGTEE
jgi:hypothetical protein